MKQTWVRLAKLCKGPNCEERFRHLFLMHHKNATEIFANKEGEPLFAIYITPIGSHQELYKRVLKTVKERMAWLGDEE